MSGDEIHVGNCPTCGGFPVQAIAEGGGGTVYRFIREPVWPEPGAPAPATKPPLGTLRAPTPARAPEEPREDERRIDAQVPLLESDLLSALRAVQTHDRSVVVPTVLMGRLLQFVRDVGFVVDARLRRVPDEQGETLGFVVVEHYSKECWLAGESLIWDTVAQAEEYIRGLHAHDSDVATKPADYRVARLVPASPESEASPDE